MVHEWVTFSCKVGICMGPILNSQWHIPTKTKVRVTPSPASFWHSPSSIRPSKHSLLLVKSRGALNFFFWVGVCGPDFLSEGLANWCLPLKRGACELKFSKFGGLWTERTSHSFNKNQPMHHRRNFLKEKFNENSRK